MKYEVRQAVLDSDEYTLAFLAAAVSIWRTGQNQPEEELLVRPLWRAPASSAWIQAARLETAQ